MPESNRRLRRFLMIRLIYLVVVLLLAIVLWFLVPADVKKAIYVPNLRVPTGNG